MENVGEAVMYYFKKLGFNTLPFNTHVKRPNVPEWLSFQPPHAISDEQIGEWLKNGTFNHGIAIMTGRVFNNPADPGIQSDTLYGIGIDCDNQAAIDIVLETFGFKSIVEASKVFMVNQHADEKDRAHFIIYSHQEPQKLKIVVNPAMKDEIDADPTMKEPPRLEILASGQLLAVPPSIHERGQPYEIPRGGTMVPGIIDNLQEKFEITLKKYDIVYGNNAVTQTGSRYLNTDRLPMEILFHPDVKIEEGNREIEAHRVATGLLFALQRLLPEDKVRAILDNWNQAHCNPPLPKRDIDTAWKSAVKYVLFKEQLRMRETAERHKRQKQQEDQDKYLASELAKIEVKAPLTIDQASHLNEPGQTRYAAGQITGLSTLHKRISKWKAKCTECLLEKSEFFTYPVMMSEYDKFEGGMRYRPCKMVNGGHCDGKLIISPTYVSAVDIEVSETAVVQQPEKMHYVLFEQMTHNIGVGEIVKILGTIYMETPKPKGRTYPIGFALKLDYEDREEEELTKEDIDRIKAFREQFPDDDLLIKEFVNMFAPDVFGHESIKEGVLYMVTNAKIDEIGKKSRLHGMIISEPGRAKTAILLAAKKLMVRATFQTCQMSTGLSLLFIVEVIEDMKMTRAGPVARCLFASLDEFNKLSSDDQDKFLGGMQEGFFTNNKFGMNHKVHAPFTLLASINPPSGSNAVLPNGKVNLSNINVNDTVLNRFDFKWYIPPMKEEEFDNLVDKKIDSMDTEFDDNSKFIKAWMTYAKAHYNPSLSAEAKETLRLGIKDMRKHSKIGARVIEAMRNTIKARARLLLKEIADEDDAARVVTYFSNMMQGYVVGTVEPQDIIDIGADEGFKVLSEIIAGVTFSYTVKELIRIACDKNSQLARYIRAGTSNEDWLSMEHNRRVTNVYDRLLKRHPEIVQVGGKPITLQIPVDSIQKDTTSDTSDATDRPMDGGQSLKSEGLSTDETKSPPESGQQNAASEREKGKNQLRGTPGTLSDVSDASDSKSTNKRKSKSRSKVRGKGWRSSTSGTSESPNKYSCPFLGLTGCHYRNADPSKISEHVQEFHDGESRELSNE